LNPAVVLCHSAIDALQGSHAVVIATEWPNFKELTARDFTENMRTPIIVDPNRFLVRSLEIAPPLTYVAVGMPQEDI
jgi:UDPglucose 6-dehydrogenase